AIELVIVASATDSIVRCSHRHKDSPELFVVLSVTHIHRVVHLSNVMVHRADVPQIHRCFRLVSLLHSHKFQR
ncbi:hypothetical protein L195_g026167, partial [Trifolium pratense]